MELPHVFSLHFPPGTDGGGGFWQPGGLPRIPGAAQMACLWVLHGSIWRPQAGRFSPGSWLPAFFFHYIVSLLLVYYCYSYHCYLVPASFS